MNTVWLFPVLPFSLLLTSCLCAMMHQWVANISCRGVATAGNILLTLRFFFLSSFFFFFSFSVFHSFYLSLFLSISSLPFVMLSPTFWWSIWINKDEISIQFIDFLKTFCRIFPIYYFSHTHTHTHTHTCIYKDCSKILKPHPDFRFVVHHSSLYRLHLHRN